MAGGLHGAAQVASCPPPAPGRDPAGEMPRDSGSRWAKGRFSSCLQASPFPRPPPTHSPLSLLSLLLRMSSHGGGPVGRAPTWLMAYRSLAHQAPRKCLLRLARVKWPETDVWLPSRSRQERTHRTSLTGSENLGRGGSLPGGDRGNSTPTLPPRSPGLLCSQIGFARGWMSGLAQKQVHRPARQH